MSTIQDIESAVSQLPLEQYRRFREWFEAFEAEAWDRQFEADVAAGKLDRLAQQAIEHFRAGRCTEL
jgi:hypothetical protein